MCATLPPKAISSIVVAVNFITKRESHWKTASRLQLGPLAPIATTLVLFDQALHRERGQGRIRPMWVFLKDRAFHGPSRNLLAPEIGLTIALKIRHHRKFLFRHMLVVPCPSSSARDESGEFRGSLQRSPSVWQWATPLGVRIIGRLAELQVSNDPNHKHHEAVIHSANESLGTAGKGYASDCCRFFAGEHGLVSKHAKIDPALLQPVLQPQKD